MKISKKLIIILSACLAALIVSLIAWLCLKSAVNALPSQDAAARWRGESEMRFAQMSCYLPVNGSVSNEDIESFRGSLDRRLVTEAIEAGEGGSLWKDAYSASGGEIEARGEYGSVKLAATGVGGDFFFFHELRLLSGGYIKESDLMHDAVVLDSSAAWKLYGSNDIAGLKITINGGEFLIAGVIEPEEDRFTERTYDDGAHIYMHYDVLRSLKENLPVTCYEIVMPDPVSGFARGVVEEIFPTGGGETVENSARYGIGALWGVLRGFQERTLRESPVAYPYWENAARLTENSAALLLPVIFIPLLVPLGCGVYGLARLGKRFSRKINERIRSRREFG